MAANSFRVLFSGVTLEIEQKVLKSLVHTETIRILSASEFQTKIENIGTETTDLVICGPEISEVSPIEMAQAYRMQFKVQPIIYISNQGRKENKKDLLKNGFDQVFLLPFDASFLDESLRSIERQSVEDIPKVYKSVPVIDFEPGTAVEFDVSVFLPLNKKYVKVFKKNSTITKEQLNHMKEKKLNSLHIEEQDFSKFVSYATKQIRDLQSKSRTSVVHRIKLQETVRNMFHELMNDQSGSFDEGKRLFSETQTIMKEFINSDQTFDLAQKLSQHIGVDSADFYEQAVRCATYAALFSLGIHMSQPEDVAIASLFCDLGLALVPSELLHKKWEDMNEEQKQIYSKHPADSLQILLDRRMVIVPDIQEAILQHHERHDGKGFPKGLPLSKISDGAKILSIACRFDELTTAQSGQKKISLLEAVEQILREKSQPPDVVHRIKDLLTAKSA